MWQLWGREGKDYISRSIRYTIIIKNITTRINKLHKNDFENYKDDYKEILKKSTITEREKCIGILTGLYDINLKSNKIKFLLNI